jgi:hypothetical protein
VDQGPLRRALDNRLPDAVTVERGVQEAVFLPGTVALGSRIDDDGCRLLPHQAEGRRTPPRGTRHAA